jgi:tetratricopeptide (TPR) repeat protein
MFDIPFIRFSVPCAILYLFFYMVVINPPVEDDDHHPGLSPEDVRVLRWKGAGLMEAQQYQEAEEVYVKLHNEFADNAVYSGELAKIRHAQKRYDQEAELWEEFVLHSPTPVEGCPQIGEAYRAVGDNVKALDALKRCWEYEPTNSDMILFYALGLEHRGNRKLAHDLYRKGHELSPRYADMTVGLARTELAMGRKAEARKLILEALDKTPDSPDALLAAGIILLRTGERQAARRYLQHGVEVSPNYEEMRLALAATGGPAHGRAGRRKTPL